MLSSPDSPSMISVRRSSPYFVRTSFSSSTMICISSRSLARIARSRSIVFSSSASSSRIFCRSRPVSRCSCMSRIACAWICDRPKLRHQAVARLGNGLRPADQLDDRVEVIERDLQAFEDVIARLGLPELELGAAADDFAAELDEALDQLEQVQHLRPAADDREHDDAEARLQRRVLVEVVEHDLGHFAALQLDDDAHAVAVGFVAQVGDAFDRLLAHQVGDPLDQLRLVDLIRNLGDDDRDPVALLVRLDRRLGAHHESSRGRSSTPARCPSRPTMKPPVGKSGPGIRRISCLSFSPRVIGRLVAASACR